MSIWILKAAAQKTLSVLPARHDVNYFFQKYLTKGVTLTDNLIEDKLTHTKTHIHYFLRYSNNSIPNKILELGTGWFPVIPICFFLNGANEILTVDLHSLLKKQNVKRAIEKILQYYETGKLSKFINIDGTERIDILKDCLSKVDSLTLDESFNMLKIKTIVDDARELNVPSNSIDLITSNNTFEHISPNILIGIIEEFKRVARHGCVMSHFIDMTDHFEHFDKSISIYNFLKYSDRKWAFIDNSIQPQNRQRITFYRKVYKQLGIEIKEEINQPGDIEKIKKIKLHQKFRDIPVGELAVYHSLLVSVMK